MQIHGREIKFLRNVGANIRVIEELAGGDAKKVNQIFDGKYSKSQLASAKFIAIMSEAYEDTAKFTDPTHTPNPLTKDEALTLTDEEFERAFSEAIQAWKGETPTVETEPVKKTKKGAAVKKSS